MLTQPFGNISFEPGVPGGPTLLSLVVYYKILAEHFYQTPATMAMPFPFDLLKHRSLQG